MVHEMYYLGVDIAKNSHVASLIDEVGKVIIRAVKFENSALGVDKLLGCISKNAEEVAVSMEATGHYWLAVYSSLTDKGFSVSVFNPYQIKSFRGAYTNRKQKNDSSDSVLIAQYLRVFGSCDTVLPQDDFLSLKQLTRFRTHMVEQISALKNTVIGLLDKIFPEYHAAFSDIFGATSKQILLNCPTPEALINISSKKLLNIISKSSNGKLGKSKADTLKSLAKSSFGVKFTVDASSFEIKQIINQIIFIEDQIDELDDKIKRIYTRLDSHLQSIPGIGPTLAPIILAEIGDIDNFEKPSKLLAFAGIDPSENQSGEKSSVNEKISKRGSPYLRHAIYIAALVAMSNDETLRAYYDKKIGEGKHHFVALAGISRKLLTIIFHDLKEKRDFIPYSVKSSAK
jgi:transposase